MKTLIPPHFVLEEVSRYDIIIASLALGFTIGFGWLTTWTAAKQTKHVWRRHGMRVWRNAYVWMIWLEIAVCLVFAIICFLYLLHVIPPRYVASNLGPFLFGLSIFVARLGLAGVQSWRL